MILAIFLILLLVSFALHIYFLVRYVSTRKTRVLKQFVNTAVSNITIAGGMTVAVVFRPDLVRMVNVQLLLWLMSGVVMVIMLLIKVSIFRAIYRRSQDPAHYHLNFFGKKVLHSTVVKPIEVMVFMITIPFFLLAGAYFVARLINLFLYKQL